MAEMKIQGLSEVLVVKSKIYFTLNTTQLYLKKKSSVKKGFHELLTASHVLNAIFNCIQFLAFLA